MHAPIGRSLTWATVRTTAARGGIVTVHLAVIAMLLVSVGQYYRPGTGLTYLIQFGDQFDARTLPAVRDAPHYVHPGSGYDGQFYAQLAVSPLLRDRSIDTALDSPTYRARRILFSWTAYVLGLGRPAWILHAYAVQNILVWLLLAWVLLRWFPVGDPKSFLLWFGSLFSYGLISSVRFALLDGPALLLLALAVAAFEQRRHWLAGALLGASGLGRENTILAGLLLMRRLPRTRSQAVRLITALGLVVVPLLIWLSYLSVLYPSSGTAGLSNFAMPLTAYGAKWQSTIAELRVDGWDSFARFSLLSLISLTVQALYLCVRVQWAEPWWRVGVVYGILMVVLAPGVWEGYPGAATRVLLPMTLAFNVLLPRSRWFWPLYVAGNLTVLHGFEAIRVPGIWTWF